MRNLISMRGHLRYLWERRFSLTFPITARSYHSEHGVHGFQPSVNTRPAYTVPDDLRLVRNDNPNLFRLVEAYRKFGHIKATLDPLGLSKPKEIPELSPSFYGLGEGELAVGSFVGKLKTAEEIVKHLESLYCGNMGVEFMHIESTEEREWFARNFECVAQLEIDDATRRDIAKEMLISQNFDHFVGAKFPTVKRYGGEGAESCMPFYKEIFKLASGSQVKQLYMCMAHRGRLNLLTGMLNMPLELMFSKMKGGNELPPGTKGIGDVLSHLTSVTDLKLDGNSLSVTLIPNPSHLEAANPFCAGLARASQQVHKDGDYGSEAADKVVCLQVHGDAAVSGQGVVQETLAFSQVPHFSVGGSLHLVVNNQVGYTTPAERGRSSRYCTDVAKSIGAPVIHVNGDDPESVVRAARLAWDYRKTFHRDIFVDVLCFRRWGHNELDEPTFTNPIMYSAVRSRPASIPDQYCLRLVLEGVMEKEDVDAILAEQNAEMSRAFAAAPDYSAVETDSFRQVGQAQAKSLQAPTYDVTEWDTGVDADVLRWVGLRSVTTSDDLALHPTLKRGHVDARISKIKNGTQIDWSTAETMALGSLLYQGFDARISGQDVGRGTFSQRHCMLVDQRTNEMYIPLNDLACPGQQGHLEVANSILSEEAVLAFEYGMSVSRPDILCIWEAQFGDFFNGAQIIIDTFVSSGETKWQLQSGLVMLLPHGYDGAGPEHSTCRPERFLQLTDSSETSADSDDVNMQVVNPTTPAQMFHLLRRQMIRPFRKPLIIAGPKTLLRLPAAVSSLEEIAPGTSFRPVIDDCSALPEKVERLIFISGKHYYAVDEHRRSARISNAAVIRLEQLCPFPVQQLQQILARYTSAKEFVWAQEEPRNAGAWSFVEPRFSNLVGCRLRYSGRPTLPAPAVGVSTMHKAQVAQLMNDHFS